MATPSTMRVCAESERPRGESPRQMALATVFVTNWWDIKCLISGLVWVHAVHTSLFMLDVNVKKIYNFLLNFLFGKVRNQLMSWFIIVCSSLYAYLQDSVICNIGSNCIPFKPSRVDWHRRICVSSSRTQPSTTLQALIECLQNYELS